MLKPWEDNPRINDEAVDAVAQSIEYFGFNVPILCDQQFTIIAGHTRWKAAKKIGMKSVPVIVVEMTEVQRRAFSIADNKTGEIADWDYPKLRDVLKGLKCRHVDLPSLGYSQAQLQALLTQQKEFDWKAFEERFKAKLLPTYVLLPVKVPARMKETFNRAIKELADKRKITNKDSAKAAGEVLALLLGVSQ
jgi:ParB-like chromosome segregation protein Spo0J